MRTKETDTNSKEEELGRLDDEQVWVDWLGTFGKELNLNTKSETKTREWLLGLIDKIVVGSKSEYDERKKKEKQIGHEIFIHFKMKIVDDSLEYIDEKKKSKGYNLKEGTRRQKTGLLRDIGLQRGRKWVKK